MLNNHPLETNDILQDDCYLLYKVIEVFTNSVIVEPFPNKGDLASEIMTFQAMQNEGWKVVGTTKIHLDIEDPLKTPGWDIPHDELGGKSFSKYVSENEIAEADYKKKPKKLKETLHGVE